jgi:hypothetical protein
MFYTKAIDIYIDSGNSATDDYGIVSKGKMFKVATIKVDVQPVSKQRVQKEYGIDANGTYNIFAPLNKHLTESAYIRYEGQMYKILNIEIWDDFIELLVGRMDD